MEMAMKRKALGRGLGALIPGAPSMTEPTAAPTMVPLEGIQPNPLQPRRSFSEDSIRELAESIRQQGLLQPLLVRRVPGGYELIAGERRFRAAQRLGLAEVPVTFRDADDRDLLEMALVENIQREDLNPLEEARAYRRLLDEFGLTQESVAARVGKERSTVANILRLLQLPSEIQVQIETGALTAGHARALVSLPSDDARLALAREVVTSRLNVRQTEQRARQQGQRPAATVDPDRQAAEERLTQSFGTRVRIAPRREGAGRLEIEYYSLDQLNGLIDRLIASERGGGF